MHSSVRLFNISVGTLLQYLTAVIYRYRLGILLRNDSLRQGTGVYAIYYHIHVSAAVKV